MSHLATPLLFALAKDQSLLPSPLGHHRLTSPGPPPFIPSHHFHLGISSLLVWNFCLHLLWGIFRNTHAMRSDVTKRNIVQTLENLPILSDMDVDTLQMHTHVKPLQILLTGYAAVPCVIRLPFTPVSSNHFDQRACNSQTKLRDPTRVLHDQATIRVRVKKPTGVCLSEEETNVWTLQPRLKTKFQMYYK